MNEEFYKLMVDFKVWQARFTMFQRYQQGGDTFHFCQQIENAASTIDRELYQLMQIEMAKKNGGVK